MTKDNLKLKSAIVTGISGQDGILLTELLLAKNYLVYGITRSISNCRKRIPTEYIDKINLLEWDFKNESVLKAYIQTIHPNEFYNFAGFSSGAGMYNNATEMLDVNSKSVMLILESIKSSSPSTRFLQASSSEMYGNCRETPQTEETPFNPRSPYGATKLLSHNLVSIYRERYQIFATSAILYNHESIYRTDDFISRKISMSVAKIKNNFSTKIVLGNLEAVRDWGCARDFAKGMWLILQNPDPTDFILSTGKLHSVKDMCKIAFAYAGLDYRNHVSVSSEFYRPNEIFPLVGNPNKSFRKLGWKNETSFEEMIEKLVIHDLNLLKKSL
ncbi:MAG: GDP-mannose 4,6-dehydratase [Bdellovibrionales bacterium]|nr:GDP-mannose 4,6-dehydratase [Bdellovibrionales bacterium]